MPGFNRLVTVASACLIAMSYTSTSAADEVGVLTDKIVFGQAAAFEGPAAALGNGMRLGIKAAFAEVNKTGGLKGKKLELITIDDSYEPDKSIKAVKKLLHEKKVFSLIGAVGTPTSKATQPIATNAKAPFIGAFTGAGFLRNSKLGNIVNIRATYGAETETWIKHLTEDLKFDKIAILYQDDAFGRVGLAGVKKAMDKRGLKLVAEGTYERNTTAVKSALLKIKKAKPQAVVMVGAYKPIASFIKLSRKVKFNPRFVNISFVGSKALAKELGKDGEGVIISQVVPFPWDSSIPVVKQYQSALKAFDANAEFGFVSLEGYIVGRLAIEALRKLDGKVTREAFLNSIWSTGEYEIGGVKLKYGTDDNQGMDKVFLSIIQKDGSFRSVDKL